MADSKIGCNIKDMARIGDFEKRCHEFENRLVYVPFESSGHEERCAFELCAEKNDFKKQTYFGWEPFTRNCSVLVSEGAKERCREVLEEEPLKENLIEVAKVVAKIAAVSALFLLGVDVALGNLRAGLLLNCDVADSPGANFARDRLQ